MPEISCVLLFAIDTAAGFHFAIDSLFGLSVGSPAALSLLYLSKSAIFTYF